jgi:hypothetical protein
MITPSAYRDTPWNHFCCVLRGIGTIGTRPQNTPRSTQSRRPHFLRVAWLDANTFIPDMSNVELSPKLKTTFLKGKFWEFNKGLVLLELEQLESEETRAGLDDEIAG